MAQLVFVHGVSARDTQEYRAAAVNRDSLFKEVLFSGKEIAIHTPMWGKLVPEIPESVFDTDKGVAAFSLKIGAPQGGAGSPAQADSNISIGAVGKQNPVGALDAILSEVIDRAASEKRLLRPEELIAFRKAADLIENENAATVFSGEANPKSISDQMKTGQAAAFGIGSFIADAATKVSDRVQNAASTLGFGLVRDGLSSTVGRFIGDVFVYLREGQLRDDIRSEVAQSIVAAHQATVSGKGPLIVIGHSMGGVILVDMLANPAEAGLPSDLKIGALLTVGSQPGFFASLNLLDRAAPGEAYAKPASVDHWLNVFDPIDPLAFRSDPIFADVTDFSFNSVTGVTQAHTKYFQRPQFYARIRKRLRDVGLM
ncbi:hypothetical protein ACVDG9_18430 [Roseibium sp. RP-7]